MPGVKRALIREAVCRIFRERRHEMEGRYPQLLKERGGPNYSARPLEELEETTRSSVEAYLAVFCGADWAPMTRFIAEIAERRFPLNFPLSEVQKAFAGFRELAMPVLVADLEGAELMEALDLLNAVVDETINRFSDRYQDLHLEKIRNTSAQLEAAHHELQSQYEEVAEAAKIKAQFFANMSHELRSPMNSVIGYAELLLDGVDGPVNEEQRQSLTRILGSARYLLKLINDVLDLSKLEAGRMEIQLEPFSVAALVKEAVDTVEPLAYRKKLSLHFDVGPDLERFVGDPDKIKLVLINLLSNAVKFTERGEVSCSAKRCDGGLEVEVRDTGIGIDSRDRERIFHKFYQVDASRGREYRGTGLGLPLSRMLIELMGGTIDFESEMGRGSRFRFTLPDRGSAETGAVEGAGYPKVLVVEDDPSSMALIVKLLEADGMEVVSALGGEEGLSLARSAQPSVITLDLLMPAVDGWSVLQELKSDPVLRGIPVAVVSCLDRHEEARRMGADAYLVKPIDRERFLKTVRELAASRRPRGSN